MVDVKPVQTDVGFAEAVPDIGESSTIISTEFEFSDEQAPFVTTALKKILLLKAFVVYESKVAPLISVQPVVPSADCCHCIIPVFPVNVNSVEFPEHNAVGLAEAVPATDKGKTFICIIFKKKDIENLHYFF